MTIHEIKNRLESVFPELIVGRDIDTGRFNIINKSTCRVVAYAYHRKWILTAAISDYANHIAAIISILDQWDGN